MTTRAPAPLPVANAAPAFDMAKWLGSARDIVFIATIYVTFAGFIYEYASTQELGLHVRPGVESVFGVVFYAYSVMMYAVRSSLVPGSVGFAVLAAGTFACIALLVLRAIARRVDRNQSRVGRPDWRIVVASSFDRAELRLKRVAAPLTIAIAVWAFPLIGTVAFAAGHDDVQRLRLASTTKDYRVWVILRKGVKLAPPLGALLERSMVRLGDVGDDVAFTFQPGPDQPGELVEIPKSDIAAILTDLPVPDRADAR